MQRNSINIRIIFIVLFGSLIISSCSAAGSPAGTMEKYLQALADKDEISAVNYSCAEWEEQALAEGASFKTVEVTLENLACLVDGETTETATVSCTGKFIFSYDAGEDQELDLAGRSFKVTKESGEWRMCGYNK